MSVNILTIDQVANLVLNEPFPILYLDTCAILDILRALSLERPNLIEAANDVIVAATSSPKRVYLIITEMINSELAENLPRVNLECEKWVNETRKRAKVLNAASKFVGVGSNTTIQNTNIINDYLHKMILIALRFLENRSIIKIGISDKYSIWAYNKANKLENFIKLGKLDISQELPKLVMNIDALAICIKSDQASNLAAIDRVAKNLPPSKKGQQSKDCLIIEHIYSLSRRLRSDGFQGKMVFVSSNTNDYCHQGILHPEIKNEFDQLDIEFTTNLTWAKSIIKI